MCSKGVWQLEELTVRFCHRAKASNGVRCVFRRRAEKGAEQWRGCRGFMLEHMGPFAKENPHLVVKTAHKPNRPAILVGKYGESSASDARPPRVATARPAVGGVSRQMEVSNMTAVEVLEAATRMRNQTGHKVVKVQHSVKTSKPTIQGFWDPTTDLSAFSLRV
jgi:large subunit ribosomal protein L43